MVKLRDLMHRKKETEEQSEGSPHRGRSGAPPARGQGSHFSSGAHAAATQSSASAAAASKSSKSRAVPTLEVRSAAKAAAASGGQSKTSKPKSKSKPIKTNTTDSATGSLQVLKGIKSPDAATDVSIKSGIPGSSHEHDLDLPQSSTSAAGARESHSIKHRSGGAATASIATSGGYESGEERPHYLAPGQIGTYHAGGQAPGKSHFSPKNHPLNSQAATGGPIGTVVITKQPEYVKKDEKQGDDLAAGTQASSTGAAYTSQPRAWDTPDPEPPVSTTTSFPTGPHRTFLANLLDPRVPLPNAGGRADIPEEMQAEAETKQSCPAESAASSAMTAAGSSTAANNDIQRDTAAERLAGRSPAPAATTTDKDDKAGAISPESRLAGSGHQDAGEVSPDKPASQKPPVPTPLSKTEGAEVEHESQMASAEPVQNTAVGTDEVESKAAQMPAEHQVRDSEAPVAEAEVTSPTTSTPQHDPTVEDRKNYRGVAAVDGVTAASAAAVLAGESEKELAKPVDTSPKADRLLGKGGPSLEQTPSRTDTKLNKHGNREEKTKKPGFLRRALSRRSSKRGRQSKDDEAAPPVPVTSLEPDPKMEYETKKLPAAAAATALKGDQHKEFKDDAADDSLVAAREAERENVQRRSALMGSKSPEVQPVSKKEDVMAAEVAAAEGEEEGKGEEHAVQDTRQATAESHAEQPVTTTEHQNDLLADEEEPPRSPTDIPAPTSQPPLRTKHRFREVGLDDETASNTPNGLPQQHSETADPHPTIAAPAAAASPRDISSQASPRQSSAEERSQSRPSAADAAAAAALKPRTPTPDTQSPGALAAARAPLTTHEAYPHPSGKNKLHKTPPAKVLEQQQQQQRGQ